MSEMTKRSGPGPAELASGDSERRAAPAARPPDRRRQRRWVPVVAAWLTFLVGLADIILGFRTKVIYAHVNHPLHRISEIVPGALSNLTRTADVIIGLLLLMLSHGLRRRKRRAWEAAMLLIASSMIIHLMHPHVAPIAVTAALLVILGLFRSEFYAIGDPLTRWRALLTLVGLLVADVAIGLAYLAVTRGLAQDYTLIQRLQSVVFQLVGFSGPVAFTSETRGDLFNFLLSGLGLFTLISACYLFLRPAKPQDRHAARDTTQVRDLLAKYGDRDSLGYFTLRDDKRIIWSATGKSCIGYRVLSGVMLASGDPLGDAEAWPGAIHAFLDEAARHAWVPAVIGCGELGAEVWCREGGLTALELGDEAVVDIADFSLKGRPMRNVRQMCSRVERHGYCAQVRRIGDIPEAEIRRMIRQADSWRGNPTERGFSMALGRVGGQRRRPLRRRDGHRGRRAPGHPALRALGIGRPLA